MSEVVRAEVVCHELRRRGFVVTVNQHIMKVKASENGPMLGSVGCHGLKSKVIAKHVSKMCERVGIAVPTVAAP